MANEGPKVTFSPFNRYPLGVNSTDAQTAMMRHGAASADMFSDLKSAPIDPNQPIRAYRGENLIKGLGSLLGSEDAAGRWYGFSEKKPLRYPFEKAPAFMGGAVTRTMDVTPLEIVEASRRAYYEHANSMRDANLRNGVPEERANNILFRNLNDIDDYHAQARTQILEGRMPSDKFNFMLTTTMEEGLFDKKGDIDIGQTFKRGNYGIAGALAARDASKAALPYLLKGAGIAALPLDLIAGANRTGLDPQEEVAQAYGIDPGVFYAMEPEKFQKIKDAYDMEVARQEEAAKDRRRGRNRARVGKDFVDAR
jgi:hypothetical protein